METKLWYNGIPNEWMEGLPIGNGRLAAMIWGDAQCDRVSLNHEWLWRGVNRYRDIEREAQHLPLVREYLKSGDFFRATALANTFFGGPGGISALPDRVDAYQPAGDLIFTPEGSTDFLRRELDIEGALASAERRVGNGVVRSEFIAHPKHNLIVCRWSASGAKFSGALQFTRVQDANAHTECACSAQGIEFSGAFKLGINYRVSVTVRTDGVTQAVAGELKVVGATEILAYINIATSVKGIEQELADYPVPEESWDELLLSHRAVFGELLGRLCLRVDLPGSDLPTDQRIRKIREGAMDPALVLLYFNFGRYLLASSSICGELPANLQGKWNDRIDPPWNCDYHFDINLQMNYWMAEPTNMPECAEALIQFVERFLPHARQAAQKLYGCRGVYFPLQTDAWGRATSESFGWAVWIGAAPWIAQHLWTHYTYNGDMGYLRDRAYPFFREVAAFYEDYLQEDETGTLQIMPSQSPENRFEGTGLFPVSIGISSAMDVQLAYDALGYAIHSAELLGVDATLSQKWQAMRDKLPAFGIGRDGRLLEWEKEREEVEPGHRHLSHLYGLHPADIFNPVDRPEQYRAAIRSLESRLSHGGGHTGWSRAWVACFFARIGRGADVWEHLSALMADFATTSLLDLHPPRIFQIDGNLGAVEAVLQCFVQSWGGKVHLLRALPPAWPNGELRGIKVPGGHKLSLRWKDGRLESVTVEMGYSESVVLADIAGKDIHLTGAQGTVHSLDNLHW